MNNVNTAMLPDANARILAKLPKKKYVHRMVSKKTINLRL
jgi:hypothetical protein